MSTLRIGGGPLAGMARVVGRSMEPTLQAGDRLWVRYGVVPVAGQIIVVRFADGVLAVKRAAERRTDRTGAPGWWVLSDNPDEGVDSRHRGVVSEQGVVGVVRARIWPRPRPL